MKRYTVTIIGMGPRGLSVLERLAAQIRGRDLLLDLVLVEPGECGQGVHSARQPQHLLINTIASQVTLFPAPGVVKDGPVCAAPALTQWARERGYRRVGEQYYRIGATGAGAEIGELDYLPRRLLGEYLTWAYEQLVASLPAGVTLTHHRLRAHDLWRQPDGRCVVELESGFIILSDFVFLTMGHGNNVLSGHDAWCRKFAQDHARYNSRLGHYRHIYPLGFPVEGPHDYTRALPRPMMRSRQVLDADRCVSAMLAQIPVPPRRPPQRRPGAGADHSPQPALPRVTV